MIKKTFFLIVAVILFPVLVLAADFWSFGSDSNGSYSGGYVGQDFSAGFDANGNFRIGSGTDGAASVSGIGEISGILIPGQAETGLPDPVGGIPQILRNLLIWMLEIIGVIALIGFVISGSQYILASGDTDVIERAKRNLTYSIIGVIVVLASFVVIQAIQYALEARSRF